MTKLTTIIDKVLTGDISVDILESKPTYSAWSLAHYMSTSKKYHKNLRVEHPTYGNGIVQSINESRAIIKWDRLGSWVRCDENITINEASSIIVSNFDK